MKPMAEVMAEARQSRDFQRLVDAIPYAGFMGISVEPAGDELVGKLRYADHLVGNPMLPALHGGATAALLEFSAIFQLLWEAETVIIPKTINITVAYLRSGRPVDTYARGVVSKHGRRVAAVHVEAWQEDRAHPIASALAHFLIDQS
jgi:acyl-coenzyme A thioesterase PaaI-like protein